jgi:hypothetical protein
VPSLLKINPDWELVAHAYNPNYPGGRDQDDQGSKPAWVNSLRDTILTKTVTKLGLVEWLTGKALRNQVCNEAAINGHLSLTG